MPQDDILSMHAITKEFPGVRALSGVDFGVRRGEVHALVGENGAGKSTLIKILAGVHPVGSYGGTVTVAGAPACFSSIRDSERAGIAVIFQELALARNLTIAENLFLGHEPARCGIIDRDRLYTESRRLLAEVGLDLSPAVTLEHLGVGIQQSVEIAKALGRNASLLVLDEPTAALTEGESDRLLDLLAALREKGVSSIYISHKLKEVFRIADRITVLRDGSSVGTYLKADLDEEKLVALMVGRALVERYPGRLAGTVGVSPEAPPATDPVLTVEDWTVVDPQSGDLACEGVSFKVFPGEILGIAGLMGAGRTELAMSLFGAWGEVRRGTLSLAGSSAARFSSPAAAIAAGLAYLSEDRKRYGLVLPMEIRENCTLAGLTRLARLGVLDPNAEIKIAEQAVADLGIKTPSIEQQVVNLSGGNQQKVVLAKWLFTRPKVLILDEPTRGIDVGAKYEIYQLMRRLVADGMAVIMISSELPEVLGMSDRILVLHEGRRAAELPRAEADQETIMQYATGSRAAVS